MHTRLTSKHLAIIFWLAAIAGLATLVGTTGNADHPEAFGHSAIRWMVDRWDSAGTDMSHAWLIPLVSLWAAWKRRHAIRQNVGAPDNRSLPLVVCSLLAYLAGIRTQQTHIVLAATILLLWSVPFYAFGWPLARQLIFPCGYLVFCIPLFFLNDLTLPLRLISTSVSATLLNGLAIPVTRIGTALHVQAGGGFSLDVAHPCSGLRYLVAMIALTSAYAHFTQRGMLRKLSLGLASIPLAMIGNIARIVLIAVVGVWFGEDVAVGFYHDYSGYVVFAVAILLMTGLGNVLDRKTAATRQTGEASPPPSPPTQPVNGIIRLHPPLVLTLLLGCTFLAIPAAMRVTVSDTFTADVTMDLPQAVGSWQGEDVLYCQDEQCNQSFLASTLEGKNDTCPRCGGKLDRMAMAERATLPADTLITRKLYRSATGPEILATIVLAGRDKRSIHRPQDCLPSQGFDITTQTIMSIPIEGAPTLDTTLIEATPSPSSRVNPSSRLLLSYWFVGGGRVTPHHLQRALWMTWDIIVHGRRSRWAYVSLQAGAGKNTAGERQSLSDFTAALWPRIQR